MAELEDFLATVSVFGALDAEERAAVAERCRERTLNAGRRLLAQGARNQSLFVLRAGQLAVRARHGDRLATIAQLGPPSVVGEISFLTGRTCSADVDVVVDATLLELPLEALAPLGRAHHRIVHGLVGLLADRLHNVVTGAAPPALTPVVILRPGRAWAAPSAFAREMTRALAYESDGAALLVRLSEGPGNPGHVQMEAGLSLTNVAADDTISRTRAQVAERLPEWTRRFSAIVISPDVPYADGLASLTPFATHACALLGPGDPLPNPTGEPIFVAQDSRQPTLPVLDGAHRLIDGVAEAEAARAAGSPPGAGFRATVGSLARAILGQQLGVALGAGGARGWCHVGALDALVSSGLPIDVVTGTSMGAVVGGLWAAGSGVAQLEEAAAYWQRRRGRMREWRLWRMHMASARQVDDLFLHYFGNRTINTLATPFWANATDIERGEPVLLQHGLLRDAARASMAFPGWAPPAEIDGRVLVDGAIVDPVPAQGALQMGAAFVVSVLAIGPYTPHPLARRYPARAYDLFARAFHLSNMAMGHARSETASDVIIAPDLGNATMLSFDRYGELIEAGRQAAQRQLPAILEAYARLRQARRLPRRSA